MKGMWILAPLAAGLVGCGEMGRQQWVNGMDEGIHGSGKLASETREVKAFQEIRAGSSILVECKVGPASSFHIEADDNILPIIKSRIDDDTLVIEPSSSFRTGNPIKVVVTTPRLVGIRVSGASQASIQGVQSNRFKVVADGASKVDAKGDLGELVVELSGASKLTGSGTTTSQELNLSGASQAELQDLPGKTAKVDASGASHLNLRISESVTGGASGASSVKVAGGAKLALSTSGASSVRSD